MIKHIKSIDVYVRDQEEALDFYRYTLEFELRADEKDEDYVTGRWVEVAPAEDQQTTLVLLEPANAVEAEDRIGKDTNVVFETEDIHATHLSLMERGVTFKWEPQKRSSGNWDCQFCDQDNNKFLLVEYYRPQGRHPRKLPGDVNDVQDS